MKFWGLNDVKRLINHNQTQSHFVRNLLRACNHIYGVGSYAHASLYNAGLIKRKRLPIPTISVGNLSFGGTGKTPIVQHLASLAAENGEKPLVLTRGYGDDEQHQLNARLSTKGVTIGIGSNRHVVGMRKMTGVDSPTIAILDDGLQHWSLERDIDIVVVNAYDHPRGLFREPPKLGLQRADMVIIHNSSSRERNKVRNEVKQMVQEGIPIVETIVELSNLYKHHGSANKNSNQTIVSSDEIMNKNVMAISGIGCPVGFVDILQNQLGASTVDSMEYPDHHVYTIDDVNYLDQRMKENSLIPVTTEKDYYRCTKGSSKNSKLIERLSPYIVATDVRVVKQSTSSSSSSSSSNDGKDENNEFQKMLKVAAERYKRRSTYSTIGTTTSKGLIFNGTSFDTRSFGTRSLSTANNNNTEEDFHHIPVLPKETNVHWLPPSKYRSDDNDDDQELPMCLMVDVTCGGGSHSEAMLENTPKNVHLLCIDRDIDALMHCKNKFDKNPMYKNRVTYAHVSFSKLSTVLKYLIKNPTETNDLVVNAGNSSHSNDNDKSESNTAMNIFGNVKRARKILRLSNGRVAGVLADLGCSSVQLDRPERGFSFQRDGPLDMRMNQSILDNESNVNDAVDMSSLVNEREIGTAADLVNNMSEASLVKLFQEGDVHSKEAKRVARLICQKRPLYTTNELVNVVIGETNKNKHYKKSPATLIFQSLRIAVNDELYELEKLLKIVPRILDDDCNFVVISFHSLEDRRVKVSFKQLSKMEIRKNQKIFQLITKKPFIPNDNEIKCNPRSRSSRLRVLKRLGNSEC